MDLRDNPDEAAFRQRLRSWLGINAPGSSATGSTAEAYKAMTDWQRALYAAGFAGLSWPREYGGQGLGPMEEAILSQELALADAPPLPPLGYLGRALLHFGSEQQRQRHLPRMLAGEELWCQGFSEPGAGSDLAGLATSATCRGGDFVITGQKIWTSYAQFADYCLLLARTGADGPPHRGISAFIVPMNQQAITVAPITQSNGHQEFSEVFYDEAVTTADNLVGELGGGWKLAMAVIGYERGAVDIGYQAKFERLLRELAAAIGNDADTEARRALGRAAAKVEVLRLHSLRSLTARAAGHGPGPEASIDKLLMTAAEQTLLDTAVTALGARGVNDPSWFDQYLYSRAASIYGGTSEIQKGIIAQRLLGMPR